MTIGIIGAMPSELVDLRAELGEAIVENIAGYEFYINEFNEKKLINVCCGVAKVNAAIATQLLIDNFKPEYIINTGIAGGMNNQIKVCDIVIADSVMHHDVTQRFLENYPPYCSEFLADKDLIGQGIKSCESFGINCFVGRIVSGEQFISDTDVKNDIVKEFSPFAVDMESAAIGHTSFRNDVPFATVRCISDNADDEGEMSFDEFEKVAARRVALVVLDMIKSL